jgi:hypothetical protein
MIRRGFWLAVGAATGIYGYRRASAVGRRLSASLNPSLNPSLDPSLDSAEPGTALTASARLARQGPRTTGRIAVRAARETYRFTRDVREGMDLYMARHSEPPGSNLSTDHASTTREPKDGH